MRAASVRESGIYEIFCALEGKSYIGSTSFLRRRFSEHKRALRKKAHHSQKLQRAWNQHGENAFVFSVIEKCNTEKLDLLEQFWIDEKRSFSDGYNAAPFVTCWPIGIKWTEERKEKVRGSGNHMFGSNRCGEKNPMFGRTHSEETKRLISVKSSERTQGKDHPLFGVVVTSETRAKISAGNKGKHNQAKGPMSQETKAKLSAKAKARYAAGFENPSYRPEVKEKIRLKAIARWAARKAA